MVTGRWCPGCGSLRALRALVTGSPAEALGLNLLLVLALPSLLYVYAAWASPRLGGPVLPRPRIPAAAFAALTVAVLVFWVLRNLPWAPLSILAP